MRTRKTIISLTASALLLLATAGAASAQVELYATDSVGSPSEFVIGGANNVSLRGTLDAPSGGQTMLVRQVAAASSCPSPQGNEVPVLSSFQAYAGPSSPLPRIGVFNGIDSSQASSRFCIFVYYDVAPGGIDNPNTSYSQVVNFRSPADSVRWFDVASAVTPDLPYMAMSGSSETAGTPAVSIVTSGAACPAVRPGAALEFAGEHGSFSVSGELASGIGFWRACAYVGPVGSGPLLKEATFSHAPRGGWRPKYKTVKTAPRAKGGSLRIGSATCPGPCKVTIRANHKGKTLLKGLVGGTGKLKMTAKLTSAGKRAAKRRQKITVVLTSTIDESTVIKRVKLKLR